MKVTYINQKENISWPKWKDINECTPKELEEYNLRTIKEDEIILDIEDQSYAPVIKQLLQDGYFHYSIVNTGSRGVHIHVPFFQLKEFSKDQRNEIRKVFIKRYKADPTKASEDTLIAEVNRPHFKTMKLCTVISDSPSDNVLQSFITLEALENLERNKVRSKEFNQDFANYHIQDKFFNYIRNNEVGDGQFRNDIIFPNIAVALVKEGLSELEIEKLMKPIIETNFKGKSYNEFKGWLKKAFNGELQDYNKIQLNKWVSQFTNFGQNLYDTKPLEVEELIVDNTNNEKKFLSFSELMKLECKTEWLITSWLPKNHIAFIVGKTGSFKSTLSLHLSLAIATGKLLFNKYETKQSKVLYLNEEMSDADMKEFTTRVAKGLDLDINGEIKNFECSLLQNWRFDQIEHPKELIEYINKNNIEVLILDSFRRFFIGQENDATIINLLFNNLKNIRKACKNLTIIMLHHTKKNNGQDIDSRDMLRGSSDMINSADTVITINRKHGEEAITIEHTKGRSKKENLLKLVKIDMSDDKAYFYESDKEIDINKKVTKSDKSADEIVTWLKTKKIVAFTKKDIEFLNLSSSTLSRALNYLLEEGTIIAEGTTTNKRYIYQDAEIEIDKQSKLS